MTMPTPLPPRARCLVRTLLPRLGAAGIALLLLRACAAPPLADPALPAPLAAMVQASRDDAARATGIDGARWRVLRAEAVTWSDGSLGCPLPDRAYTQALVPGYLVRLQAEGTTRSYHAGEAGIPRWCPEDRVRRPLPADARR